ncbi:hypothetical protein J7U46_07415 [Pelomonas sp. V22]|uniref:hypothetical protein n=1 Tax=Pelomonas sp. V22 TaxID=2822139 RepID=UPI0024A8281C|nr:hypothetical protein [Pelomonas sp. V22]MDI4632873.1 hypothetical protein [Pelomonas sp. V22]
MQKVIRLALLALCSTLGACATHVHVAYLSDPPGAAVYQGGQLLGNAPVTVPYQLTDADRKNGYKIIDPVSVKWESGAEASIPGLNANLMQVDQTQQYVFLRPNVPGLETDLKKAESLQKEAVLLRNRTAQAMVKTQEANKPKTERDCRLVPMEKGPAVLSC